MQIGDGKNGGAMMNEFIVLDDRTIDTNSRAYCNAQFHLLVAEISCYRYWGQGVWTEYAKEIFAEGPIF